MEEVTPAEIAALHEEFGDRPHPPKPHRERRALAWLIAAPWLLAALMRLLALDDAHPLVELYAFVPFAAVTSPLPIAVALFLRVRPAVLAGGGAMILFAVLLAGRAIPGPRPPAHGRMLTVMTANTYVGGADPRAIIALARNQRVDVLALQELTPQLAEVLNEDGLSNTLPYSLQDTHGGPFGGGLWSRLPLRRTFIQTDPHLSQSPEASIAGLGVTVRSVHPPTPTSGYGVRRWHAMLAALPGRATDDGTLRVFAGDFNATLDHKALRAVLDRGYTDAADATGQGLVGTWPATLPFALTLDHVLVDKRIRVLSVKILHMPGSDHRALIARLRLP